MRGPGLREREAPHVQCREESALVQLSEGDLSEGYLSEGDLSERAAEGLFVKPGEARHVGTVDPPAHRQDYAEKLGDEVAPAFSNRDVVNLAHLCEDRREHGRENRLCRHRSLEACA